MKSTLAPPQLLFGVERRSQHFSGKHCALRTVIPGNILGLGTARTIPSTLFWIAYFHLRGL